MRRRLTYLSAAVAVMAALIVAVVVAGGGAGSGTAVAVGSGDAGPRAILEKAMAVEHDLTSAQAEFRVVVKAELDPAEQAPSQAAMVLDKPIEVSGTVAADSDPFVGAVTVDVSLGGGSYATQVAMRWVGDQAWLKVMGVWYEAPPEMTQRLAEAQEQMAAGGASGGDGADSDEAEAGRQALAAAGIDPWSWVTGLELVGSEPVGGAEAYRVVGGLDVRALVNDVVAFSAAPRFQELMKEHAPPEALAEFRQLDRAEMERGAAMVAGAVRDVRGEVSIDVQTYRVLRAAGSVTVVPPAEAEADWLRSVDVSATVSYDGFDEPVTVTPPTDPLPWERLQALSGGDMER